MHTTLAGPGGSQKLDGPSSALLDAVKIFVRSQKELRNRKFLNSTNITSESESETEFERNRSSTTNPSEFYPLLIPVKECENIEAAIIR